MIAFFQKVWAFCRQSWLILSIIFILVTLAYLFTGQSFFIDLFGEGGCSDQNCKFVGNVVSSRSDIDLDSNLDYIRVDAFNFWGGNGGQNVLIVQDYQKSIIGCWNIGEYRSSVKSITNNKNTLFVDVKTHRVEDGLANPTLNIRYTFFYDYYHKALLFDNTIGGLNKVYSTPRPCTWDQKLYLSKKDLSDLDIIQLKLMAIPSLLLQHEHESKIRNFYNTYPSIK
jgi:hypothetical protein